MTLFCDHQGNLSSGKLMAYLLAGLAGLVLLLPYAALFWKLPGLGEDLKFTDLTAYSHQGSAAMLTAAWGFYTSSKAPETVSAARRRSGAAAAADPSVGGVK